SPSHIQHWSEASLGQPVQSWPNLKHHLNSHKDLSCSCTPGGTQGFCQGIRPTPRV
ncbi:hypothetical protein SK128_002649, partial [Halocaridina rubra]